jgi:hypothetical protein
LELCRVHRRTTLVLSSIPSILGNRGHDRVLACDPQNLSKANTCRRS